MQLNIKKFTPLVILGVLMIAAVVITRNPPETERRAPPRGPQLVVETLTVQPTDYQVRLQSYGTVQPRTRSMLVAQVGGQITWVDPSFRDGGFFNEGDVLARIDQRDYEADMRIAEAALMDARQALAEAEARSKQAEKDWERLGNTGTPPDLVLRLPQLEAARARISSAQSNLEKARLDLERTRISAPYAGRVLRKLVDVGQVVSPNSQLAEIFASDYVEVRLPIKNQDLKFLELPETYLDAPAAAASGASVSIRSDLAGEATWQAELVRTEGAIDEAARQLHVIAQIDNPFRKRAVKQTPLKIGQYVTAEIAGSRLENAIVIPNGAIYQRSYTYVVEDGILRRREVSIDWQNEREAVISAGLRPDDLLVTTPLGQVTSGIRVAIANADEEQDLRTARKAASDARKDMP